MHLKHLPPLSIQRSPRRLNFSVLPLVLFGFFIRPQVYGFLLAAATGLFFGALLYLGLVLSY